jgi:hypothetical protein
MLSASSAPKSWTFFWWQDGQKVKDLLELKHRWRGAKLLHVRQGHFGHRALRNAQGNRTVLVISCELIKRLPSI